MPSEAMKRVHLWISGRVQGVCFRYATQDAACGLGLTGWVRNLPDGRVETVAEGEPAAIERFIAYCHEGPPMAHVRHVERIDDDATGEFDSFFIR
ncbi:MAG: acylphosphatase [Planctomycetota bacterium]